MLKLVLGIAILTANPVSSTEEGENCPTWTFREQNSSTCICGQYLRDIICCDNQTLKVQLLNCYCMTSSEIAGTQVVGNCMYNCGLNSTLRVYYSVPRDVDTLDNKSCGRYNRRGQMCSQCREGYGVSVYSYNYCTRCSTNGVNFLWYLGTGFLPLTLFYLVVVIVNLDTTRTILSSYVLFGQIITAPITSILYEFRTKNSASLSTIATLYGVWNLDFGRTLYKPFCLHPHLSTHQVIALDYLIALYPLLLILLTYLLVKLHDKYRLAVIICKPFYCCIRCIQKEWNIKASLVDVFATFLLLSYVKLLNVSFDLISVPVTIWSSTGDSLPHKYTYFNGSMEYLGKEHLPYFVLGVAVVIVFNCLPILLLCLYPLRRFQRCLNYCSLSSPSLHIFMDAFQGCYKTTPRDYRFMASLRLLFRLAMFFIFCATKNRSFFTLVGILSSLMLFLTMFVRPYKKKVQADIEGLMFLTIALLFFLLSTSKPQIHVDHYYKEFYLHFRSVLCMFPTLIILVLVAYSLITNSKIQKKTVSVLPAWKCFRRFKTYHDNDEYSHLLPIN
jgi:hypothetical protein